MLAVSPPRISTIVRFSIALVAAGAIEGCMHSSAEPSAAAAPRPGALLVCERFGHEAACRPRTELDQLGEWPNAPAWRDAIAR